MSMVPALPHTSSERRPILETVESSDEVHDASVKNPIRSTDGSPSENAIVDGLSGAAGASASFSNLDLLNTYPSLIAMMALQVFASTPLQSILQTNNNRTTCKDSDELSGHVSLYEDGG